MKSFQLLTLFVLLSVFNNAATAQQTETPAWAKETAEQKDKRMAWWKHDRFGMFMILVCQL